MSISDVFNGELSRRGACKFIAVGALAAASSLVRVGHAPAEERKKHPRFARRHNVKRHAEAFKQLNEGHPYSLTHHEETLSPRNNVPRWWKETGNEGMYRLTEIFVNEGEVPDELFVLTSAGGFKKKQRTELRLSRLSFLGNKKNVGYWGKANSKAFMMDAIGSINRLEPKLNLHGDYDLLVKVHPRWDWPGYAEILKHTNTLVEAGVLNYVAHTEGSVDYILNVRWAQA